MPDNLDRKFGGLTVQNPQEPLRFGDLRPGSMTSRSRVGLPALAIYYRQEIPTSKLKY